MKLTTTRLVLRDLRQDDAITLAKALNNFNISRNTSSIPYPYTLANAFDFIARQKSKVSASVKKIIALKSAPNVLIGSVRLHIDTTANTCELGYWVAEPHWGKGYATEAATSMLEHAFTVLNFPAVIADYNADNPASGRVLQRLGFTETGTSEGFSVAQGKLVPVILMRLKREDWQTA